MPDEEQQGDDIAEALMREALESVKKIESEGKEGEVEVEMGADPAAAEAVEAEPCPAPAEEEAASAPEAKKPVGAAAIRGAPAGAVAAAKAAAAGGSAGGADAAELARVKETLGKVEAARKDNYDKWMRAMAEMENFRKRVQKDRSELIKFGHEGLARELLGVVDNLERALAAAGSGENDPALKQLVEGVEMTRSLFLQTLARFEVKPFESVGKPFDPALHQAMSRVPAADVPPNTVLSEMQKGYMIYDRLLRPAMVAVAVEPEDVEPAPGSGETGA